MKCHSCGHEFSLAKIMLTELGKNRVPCSVCGKSLVNPGAMILFKIFAAIWGVSYMLLAKYVFSMLLIEVAFLVVSLAVLLFIFVAFVVERSK